MSSAICSCTVGILINVRNIANLALVANVTAINTMFRNHQSLSVTSFWKPFESSVCPLLWKPAGREAAEAFGNTWSRNPGICLQEQMSQKLFFFFFWITATRSPTAQRLCLFYFFFPVIIFFCCLFSISQIMKKSWKFSFIVLFWTDVVVCFTMKKNLQTNYE